MTADAAVGTGAVPRTPETLVDVRGVSLTYRPTDRWLRWLIRSAIDRPVHALTDVDLTLQAGRICGVIGPNGAGKSSLFRLLVGLLLPSEGTVRVVGVDTAEGDLELRRHVGFMPADDRTLFLRYSCVENLQFQARLHGYDARQAADRIDEVLEQVELTHARDRAAVALSSGMRYRLLLARALVHRPRLLILDEPTGPMDPVTAHRFIETLKAIVDRDGVGVLISSHRMDDIEALPDRVVLLDEGEVVYDGGVDRLRNLYVDSVVTLTTAGTAAAQDVADVLRRLPDVDEVAVDETTLRVTTHAPVGPLLHGLGDLVEVVVDVSRAPMALRDVMARVIGERRMDGRA